MVSIGENIKKKRKEKGMTQAELAEKINVTHSMISQLERGTKVPTMLLGAEIAKVLGCGIQELLPE